MAWAEERALCWAEDRERVEERGCFAGASAGAVSARARARGRTQCGSLGSGNHYAEVQVVDEVFDEAAAAAMGLARGTVCVMLHSGSRGLGHQVCTDSLEEVSRAMAAEGRVLVDAQLACARVESPEGQRYLAAMRAVRPARRPPCAWRPRHMACARPGTTLPGGGCPRSLSRRRTLRLSTARSWSRRCATPSPTSSGAPPATSVRSPAAPRRRARASRGGAAARR